MANYGTRYVKKKTPWGAFICLLVLFLAPVAKYGNVSVIIGDTTKLTRKIERLKAIMPSLEEQSGTLHLESWTEETTNIVFDKSE